MDVGNGNDRSNSSRTDVMKLLGLPGNTTAASIEGITKSWDTKYQIPKLSARSSANEKDASTASQVSNAHYLTNYQMASSSNKLQGGRASSVSPKYSLTNDTTISNYSKDLHIYKSTSSDALQPQTQSQLHGQQKTISFSNPTTPTSTTPTLSAQISSSIPFSHQLNSSGNNAFASFINKSPLHQYQSTSLSPKIRTQPSNLPTNHNTNSNPNPNTNPGNVSIPTSRIGSNSGGGGSGTNSSANSGIRRPSKSNEKIIDFSSASAFINSNMRSIQTMATASTAVASIPRRPSSKTPPQAQMPIVVIPSPSSSSDDDILDETMIEIGSK